MAGVEGRVGGFQRDLSPYFQASVDLPELPTGLKDVDGKGYKKYDAEIREWWASMQQNLDRLQDQLINYRILDVDEKHSDLNNEAIASLNAASIGLNASITNEASYAAAASASLQTSVSANQSSIGTHIADTANPHGVTATQAGAYTIAQANTAISSAIANLIDSAPGTLDTLNELASALGDDANFASTVATIHGTHATAIAANASAIAANTTHRGVTTGNPHSVNKADVGLGSADNTTDANKPVSTAQQTALNLKATTSSLSSHTGSTSNPHSVTASQVGLGSTSNHASIPTTDLIDEDDMATDSATKVPSQQSVKKYVDDQVVTASSREFHYARFEWTGSSNYFTVQGFHTSAWGTGAFALGNYGSGLNSNGTTNSHGVQTYGGVGAAMGTSPLQYGANIVIGSGNNLPDSNCPFELRTYAWLVSGNYSFAEIIVPSGGGTWKFGGTVFGGPSNTTTYPRTHIDHMIVGASTAYPNGAASQGSSGGQRVGFLLYSQYSAYTAANNFGGLWERIG